MVLDKSGDRHRADESIAPNFTVDRPAGFEGWPQEKSAG